MEQLLNLVLQAYKFLHNSSFFSFNNVELGGKSYRVLCCGIPKDTTICTMY